MEDMEAVNVKHRGPYLKKTTCFVPGCGNHTRKSHLFRAPPSVTDKWVEILRKVRKDVVYDRNNLAHKVCHEHFEESEILKVNRYLIQGKLLEDPKRIWTLQPEAVPTIFDCLSSCRQPNHVKKPRGRRPTKSIQDINLKREPPLKLTKVTKSYQGSRRPPPSCRQKLSVTESYYHDSSPPPSSPHYFDVDEEEGPPLQLTPVTKIYQHRGPPMGGRYKFKVEGHGKCFMCLELIEEDNDRPRQRQRPGRKRKMKSGNSDSGYNRPMLPAVCSLKKLTRYLEVDLVKIFRPSRVIAAMEETDVEVQLCGKCSTQAVSVSELLKELESVQNRVNAAIKEFSKLVVMDEERRRQSEEVTDNNNDEEEDEDGQTTLPFLRRVTTPFLPEEDPSVATKLRKELISKCCRHQVKQILAALPRPMPKCSVRLQRLESLKSSLSSNNNNNAVNEDQGQEGQLPATPLPFPQQEIEFIYQPEESEGVPIDLSDIGRFQDEDLFPEDNNNMDSDTGPATPSNYYDEADDDQEGAGTNNTSFQCIFCKKTYGSENKLKQHHLRFNYHGNGNPDLATATPASTSDPDPVPEPVTESSAAEPLPNPEAKGPSTCLYCPKTFYLKCNVRTHILSAHRFQVFRKHLPTGTRKKLVLSEVKKILQEHKELEEGKIGCNYCTRIFTKGELSLLVDQNHKLVSHFNEVVLKLKKNIGNKNGQVGKVKESEKQKQLDTSRTRRISDSETTAANPSTPPKSIQQEQVSVQDQDKSETDKNDADDDDVVVLDVSQIEKGPS